MFEIEKNRVTPGATALCLICAMATGGLVVSKNVAETAQNGLNQSRSATQQSARSKALDSIAKQYRVRNCWIVPGPYTIGQIVPALATGGDRPTDSITTTDRLTGQTQFALIAIEGGVMKIQFVFTATEIQNQLSQN